MIKKLSQEISIAFVCNIFLQNPLNFYVHVKTKIVFSDLSVPKIYRAF